jgi:hypothetical protein
VFATPIQSATNKIGTVPAPIGGLNARDSLAAMPETDAYLMMNYWPQPYGVSMRLGYQTWATTGTAREIGTIAPWAADAGAQKLFAWDDTAMWDISVKGNATLPIIASGITNAYWQFINFSNAAGAHLVAVNGADDGILYDAGGPARIVAGDGIVSNTWSGLDPKDAIQLTVHQHRLWATKKDSSLGYYLKTLDAYYGVFESYDFGPLFSFGGYIAFMTTWTIDDGNGAEDHLVVVSSMGQAAVYAGIDPTDAATWALVGVYNIGAPVAGRRAYTKVGGDLYIVTTQGIISMASLLVSTRVNEQVTSFPSYKIQFLISDLTSTYGQLQGWQLAYAPSINMLICNVPTTVEGGNLQLASNQITSAWTQFQGMDATCWTLFNGKPFFADYAGRVFIAWEGYLDHVELDGTGGTSIAAIVGQAYSYLGSLGTQKQVGMYRPNFLTTEPFNFTSAITYDFKDFDIQPPDSVPIPPGLTPSLWDVGIWDQNKWGAGFTNVYGWVQAAGMGVAASITLSTKSNGSLLWVSTDYSYKSGSLL